MSIATTELETKKSKSAWFAINDADRYSTECASRYTSKQRATAQTAVDLLDMAYRYKGLYTNFRKTFIAIKVDNAQVKNRAVLIEVDAILEGKGFTKAVTPQGVVYRLA
jgi:hypothetical protein